jgi:hypothetical protein
MKATLPMVLAALLLWPAQAVRANCVADEARVKGDTPEACEASAAKLLDEKRLGECVQAPDWKARIASQLADCTRQVMDDRLDLRLLKLKKADRKQFSAEMKLQKLYNQSIQEQCSLYEACGGASNARRASECRDQFHRYRAAQAVPINEHELTLKDGVPQSDASPLRQQFAEALCALPKKVWAGDQVPDNCVPRALFELEQAVGPFQPHPCTRFECPESQRVRLDLKPWEQSEGTSGTEGPGEHLVWQLLRQLGEGPTGQKCQLAAPLVSLIDNVALVDAETQDRLLRFDFDSDCYGFHATLLVVLHPLGEGEWCKLGSLGANGRGFGGCSADNPLSFESVHLTDPGRETLRIVTRQSDSALRDDGNRECAESQETTFYDVRGAELVPVFDSNGEARVIPEGPYPRAILAPSKEDFITDTVYRFVGGEYVTTPKPSK